MKVKPAAGRAVRHPTPPYELLPAEGREVPDNQYWRRRIRDGDVEVVTAEAPQRRRPEGSAA
jgi:hypothetical protein